MARPMQSAGRTAVHRACPSYGALLNPKCTHPWQAPSLHSVAKRRGRKQCSSQVASSLFACVPRSKPMQCWAAAAGCAFNTCTQRMSFYCCAFDPSIR